MSKKGRARSGTVKRKAGGAVTPPPAPGSMKAWAGGGWATIGWGSVSMDFAVQWNVMPTDRLTGSVGSHAHWEAVRSSGGVMTHEVQMAEYICRVWTTSDISRAGSWSPPVMIGPFYVMHRPDDGDIMLAAKVLSMVAVQPGWEAYKAYVRELDR